MAKINNQDNKVVERINEYIDTNFDTVLSTCFARYAKYVIQDRALPDIRDGLKPVQRRIIYAMHNLGLTYDKDFKKCARIVGEVIGKYHPHGDTSVYEALVRLSQNWKMSAQLISVHGNNGSIDGDSPAAMRYTEAKLSEISEYIVGHLDKKITTFQNNFDDAEEEPTVFPTFIPNLLVNGATGIAAGYATDIPPHNLTEVINAIIYCLHHQNFSIDNVLDIIQGPDFPTGGEIIATKEQLKEIYSTGKGKIFNQAKTTIIATKKGYQIVIDELPFNVIKSNFIESIYKAKEKNNIQEIKDILDESGRNGLKIIIITDCVSEEKTKQILEFLCSCTSIREPYSYNMVAIHNHKPTLLTLKDLIKSFINFQKEITIRSSKFDLVKHTERLNLVEGLIKSVSILDEIIALVRKASNRQEIIRNLIDKFSFNEKQATAIADLRLYRLSSTDVSKLEEEQKHLVVEIKRLNNIINNETILIEFITNYLTKLRDKFGINRRTKLNNNELVTTYKTQIFEKQVTCVTTYDGYVRVLEEKINVSESAQQLIKKDGDAIVSIFESNTLDKFLVITNRGNYVLINVHEIGNHNIRDLGTHLHDLRKLDGPEKIIFAMNINHNHIIDEQLPERTLVLVTKDGRIKRMSLKSFAETKIKAMSCYELKPEDSLLKVLLVTPVSKNIVLFTHSKYIIYSIDEIPYQNLKTSGVKAFNIKLDERIVQAHLIGNEPVIGIVLNNRQLIVLPIDTFEVGKKSHTASKIPNIKPKNKIVFILTSTEHYLGYWLVGLSTKTTIFLTKINSATLKNSLSVVKDDQFEIIPLNSITFSSTSTEENK
ncbi:hypothetical protein ASO20_00320 [Mycoplasma sp. (ex Biomphalaria glabrata)]|uniref:DNA gyrase/topoisomerase IV subunit A n=1 Tax=Mycoplasma sp. (ex Biomphalaria glabrata) TaxID=1749074 RepID=UPI00073A8B6B|nr:DNA topoisomerase (ATP-hydrolyzing) subunit A [Mycoplasma sp. (ex Biomphalaria glabrata)]ALV23126.1 hypothetical protein ASO20_00320 [Mycoplasma sp. (ex Biomphalaria glabrata)]